MTLKMLMQASGWLDSGTVQGHYRLPKDCWVISGLLPDDDQRFPAIV